MNLAARDISHNLGRFALTSIGIGLLLMVVMGMGGIYRGIVEDATLLVERIGADYWVVQRDTRGPFAEISRVPPSLLYRVRAVPGVAQAHEFVSHTIQRQREGSPLRITVQGLSWPHDKGDWVPLVAGRPLRRNHFEMIADRTLNLPLGEKVRLGKETYTVVGVCRDMLSSGGDGIAFVTVADAQTIQYDQPPEATRLERAARRRRGERNDLIRTQPALGERANLPSSELSILAAAPLSAVLVNLHPGADRAQVEAIIGSWTDVTIHSREAENGFLLQGPVEKSRRQIGLFRVVLTLIAGIIMMLIIYTLTLDKLRSIALLKLIGAPSFVILGMILQQAVALGAIGFALAYLIGKRLFPMFPRRVIVRPDDLWMLALVVLVISCLASILGIVKALRVSPGEALN
jgi:putative ABC transport system permease protein